MEKTLRFLTILLVVIIGLVDCHTSKIPINERIRTPVGKTTEETTLVKP
ncbi:hypothetical protein [Alkaliphilus sp. B6464]|nr:hypothetical protein [Alkaliphilus sp. B6464]QUH20269.1 hypothetical protein HYG84_10370 [Alkaliphilus sp. B6464]